MVATLKGWGGGGGGGLSPMVLQDIVLVPMPGPPCGGLLSLRICMHAMPAFMS